MKRVAPGVYRETIGGHEVLVMLNEGTGFWQLVVNDEWWQSFATKRETLEAVQYAISVGDL